jgi:hypothetical protein
MIANLLANVKHLDAAQARKTLAAVRDELVALVTGVNQSIDLLDIIVGTGESAAVDTEDEDDEEDDDEPAAPRKKRAKGKRAKANGRGNGHADKAFITRGGKPSIAQRVHEVLAAAPAEGWTSEDCAKRLKGIEARRVSITLAGLAKSGRAKKVSYGHYVSA